MSTEEPETNPYELLSLGVEATEQEIKTAYRKLSLKVHPDRNPNNPLAAQKFHELNQAYELLLDPLRRLALNSSVKAKEARKARYAKFDAKRKHFQEELDERERAFKKRKDEKERDAKEVEQENERIKEAGRRLREEKEKEHLKKQAKEEFAHIESGLPEDIAPRVGKHDTTVKLKFSISARPELAERSTISTLMSRFGAIDDDAVILSVKPSKKAPHKPPKFGTAVVEFKQIRDAFGAVCASGNKDRGMENVEIDWVEGKEPPILEWLKRQGMLRSTRNEEKAQLHPTLYSGAKTSEDLLASLNAKVAQSKTLSSFSSFPESFSSEEKTSLPTKANADVSGLDYESLTFMRLRQAEREKIEREILEQEAKE